MGKVYKIKQDVAKFIIDKKHNNPDISCRSLVNDVEKKFGFKISKSSINSIFLKEKLSSPIGRRSKALISLEGEVEHGGFSILLGIDNFLGLSRMAALVLARLCREDSKSFLKDAEDMFRGFIIFKSIFDLTLEPARCYNNKEIWSLVGRRPPKSVYYRILKAVQDTQIFMFELVREFEQGLRPIASFRFQLNDGGTFFVDASRQTIWQEPPHISSFLVTHYTSNIYINEFINNERALSIFNIQETNILSPKILSFILCLNSQNSTKQIKQIELIDTENNVLDNKLILDYDKRFFLLGFWPWQLEVMSVFERKPAKQRFIWSDLGVEFYYQIEKFSIPQHLVEQEVKLTVIILRNSPLGAARIGILTNIPEDIIHNYLTYKELYNWIFPEDRYKDFIKLTKGQLPKEQSPLSATTTLFKELEGEFSWDRIFSGLSHFLFHQFQHNFLPVEFRSWNPLKIKEVFLRQKAALKRTRGLIVHNIMVNNELCKEPDLKYISQRLNESGARDNQERLLWFQMGSSRLKKSAN